MSDWKDKLLGLVSGGSSTLAKAETEGKHKEPDGDEGGGEKEGYDASYMKKHMAHHMKKHGAAFMKEHGDEMHHMMASHMKHHGKEFMEKHGHEMKKHMGYMEVHKANLDQAVDSIGDMSTADATLVNGTEMFGFFKQLSDSFVKATQAIGDRLEALEGAIGYQSKVTELVGEGVIKASESLDLIKSQPNPYQGVRGAGLPAQGATTLPEGSPLAKAAQMGSGLGGVLLKAAQNPNNPANITTAAARLLTILETNRWNVQALQPQMQQALSAVLATSGN